MECKKYKEGWKDVLIATDLASKGMDFANVQHIINYDMPTDIEKYVHRVGRTGRCGKTGIATTFVSKACDESVLRDLRSLLIEARQRLPLFLAALDSHEFTGNCNIKECTNTKQKLVESISFSNVCWHSH